jgi:hypothetical protein
MDEVQNTSNSKCYAPSSESSSRFRYMLHGCCLAMTFSLSPQFLLLANMLQNVSMLYIHIGLTVGNRKLGIIPTQFVFWEFKGITVFQVRSYSVCLPHWSWKPVFVCFKHKYTPIMNKKIKQRYSRLIDSTISCFLWALVTHQFVWELKIIKMR